MKRQSLLKSVCLLAFFLPSIVFAEEPASHAGDNEQKMSYSSHVQGWSPDRRGDVGVNDDDDDERVSAYEQKIRDDIAHESHDDEQGNDELRKTVTENEASLDNALSRLRDHDEQLKKTKKRSREDIREGMERMARVYEQMPPKNAASICNIMDMRALVLLSQHMNPRKMSSVMGGMDPDRANILSQYIAGIRKLSPETLARINGQ